MTTAEQFECLIPSPNALKEGVLYCSTNATNAVDIWVAVGTIGSAVAAVLLAFWTVYDTRRRFRHETQVALESKMHREWAERSKTLHEEGDKVIQVISEMNVKTPENLLDDANRCIDAVTRYRNRIGDIGKSERDFGEALGELAQMLGMKIFNLTQHYEIDEDIPKPSTTDLNFDLGFKLMNVEGLVGSALIGLAQAKTDDEARTRADAFIASAAKLTNEIEKSL